MRRGGGPRPGRRGYGAGGRGIDCSVHPHTAMRRQAPCSRTHRLGRYGRAAYRGNHVRFVFQFYNLIPVLTARENVAPVTGIAQAPMKTEAALDLVGLGPRMDHSPHGPRAAVDASDRGRRQPLPPQGSLRASMDRRAAGCRRRVPAVVEAETTGGTDGTRWRTDDDDDDADVKPEIPRHRKAQASEGDFAAAGRMVA